LPGSFGYGAVVVDEGRALALPAAFFYSLGTPPPFTVEDLLRALVGSPCSWRVHLEIQTERFEEAYGELLVLIEPYVDATFVRVARGAALRRKRP
jgi:hypothetical protein